MGVNIRGAHKRRVTSPPALSGCPPSPAWLILSWPQPQNKTLNPRPLPSGHGPPHPPRLHLAPYSASSLELLCLCSSAHVIPLPRRPFLLFVLPNNFPWVLPGRLPTLCTEADRCGEHRPGLRPPSFTPAPTHSWHSPPSW